jgi:hypothetical protein
VKNALWHLLNEDDETLECTKLFIVHGKEIKIASEWKQTCNVATKKLFNW